MKYTVIHNYEENRFEAMSQNLYIGLIDYNLFPQNKLIIVTHTEVAPEYEGQGIAKAMTKGLLEYAKQEELSVIAICPYTKAYMERHPEYFDLMHK